MIRGSPRVALWGVAFLGVVGAAAAEPTRLYQYNFNKPRPGGGVPFTFAYGATSYQNAFRYWNSSPASDPTTPQGPFDYGYFTPVPPLKEAVLKAVNQNPLTKDSLEVVAVPDFIWEYRRNGTAAPTTKGPRRYLIVVNFQMNIYRVDVTDTPDELNKITSAMLKCGLGF